MFLKLLIDGHVAAPRHMNAPGGAGAGSEYLIPHEPWILRHDTGHGLRTCTSNRRSFAVAEPLHCAWDRDILAGKYCSEHNVNAIKCQRDLGGQIFSDTSLRDWQPAIRPLSLCARALEHGIKPSLQPFGPSIRYQRVQSICPPGVVTTAFNGRSIVFNEAAQGRFLPPSHAPLPRTKHLPRPVVTPNPDLPSLRAARQGLLELEGLKLKYGRSAAVSTTPEASGFSSAVLTPVLDLPPRGYLKSYDRLIS